MLQIVLFNSHTYRPHPIIHIADITAHTRTGKGRRVRNMLEARELSYACYISYSVCGICALDSSSAYQHCPLLKLHRVIFQSFQVHVSLWNVRECCSMSARR